MWLGFVGLVVGVMVCVGFGGWGYLGVIGVGVGLVFGYLGYKE